MLRMTWPRCAFTVISLISSSNQICLFVSAGRDVDQDIGRLDILMDEVAFVKRETSAAIAMARSRTCPTAMGAPRSLRSGSPPTSSNTCTVRPGVVHQIQWPRLPRFVELIPEVVFLEEAIEGRERRMLAGKLSDQQGAPMADIVLPPAAAEDASRSLTGSW